MHRTLFLLCPTDYLESTINREFNQENYFYSSLGNSFVMDSETLESIKALIKKHRIQEINFVLSSNNKIIVDALGEQFFSDVKGLKTFYDEVILQRERSEFLWQTNNHQFSILSYFLNNKIKELKLALSDLTNDSIKIRGKIYNNDKNIFRNIYSNLICIEKHFLN